MAPVVPAVGIGEVVRLGLEGCELQEEAGAIERLAQPVDETAQLRARVRTACSIRVDVPAARQVPIIEVEHSAATHAVVYDAIASQATLLEYARSLELQDVIQDSAA